MGCAVENVLIAKIRIKQTHNLKEPKSPQQLYYFIYIRRTQQPNEQGTGNEEKGHTPGVLHVYSTLSNTLRRVFLHLHYYLNVCFDSACVCVRVCV